jgi:DNA-binding Lrp family transcriptional regulator
MAKAYLRINVTSGQERRVRDRLRKIRAVKSADLTAGDQDIICVVEAPTYDRVLKIVVEKLRTIKGITKTSTNLVLE